MKGLKKLTENTSIPQQSLTNPLTKMDIYTEERFL